MPDLDKNAVPVCREPQRRRTHRCSAAARRRIHWRWRQPKRSCKRQRRRLQHRVALSHHRRCRLQATAVRCASSSREMESHLSRAAVFLSAPLGTCADRLVQSVVLTFTWCCCYLFYNTKHYTSVNFRISLRITLKCFAFATMLWTLALSVITVHDYAFFSAVWNAHQSGPRFLTARNATEGKPTRIA